MDDLLGYIRTRSVQGTRKEMMLGLVVVENVSVFIVRHKNGILMQKIDPPRTFQIPPILHFYR